MLGNVDTLVATLLGFHRAPWWLLGSVLAAAIVSRTAVFFWMMWHRKN